MNANGDALPPPPPVDQPGLVVLRQGLPLGAWLPLGTRLPLGTWLLVEGRCRGASAAQKRQDDAQPVRTGTMSGYGKSGKRGAVAPTIYSPLCFWV